MRGPPFAGVCKTAGISFRSASLRGGQTSCEAPVQPATKPCGSLKS